MGQFTFSVMFLRFFNLNFVCKECSRHSPFSNSIPACTNPELPMHGSRKFCQRESKFDNILYIFFSWWGEGGSKYHNKWAIIGPPEKRHLNGVLLACRCWPNIEFFRGDTDPCPPPSESAANGYPNPVIPHPTGGYTYLLWEEVLIDLMQVSLWSDSPRCTRHLYSPVPYEWDIYIDLYLLVNLWSHLKEDNISYTIFTPDRGQSKTLLTINEHRSKIARNGVFYCHLSPLLATNDNHKLCF